MFEFFGMLGNHATRCIGRWPEGKEWIVDTVRVTDSKHPYETAVKHHRYNDGAMVIVEMYDTKEEAKCGHDRWVEIMSREVLPASLKDVSTAECAITRDILGGDESWRERPISEE